METKEQLLKEEAEWLVKCSKAYENAKALTPVRNIPKNHPITIIPKESRKKYISALKKVDTISAKLQEIEGKLSNK